LWRKIPLMFSIFRKGRGRREMILAMVGVRMGERLVCVGAGDPASFAALATKVGLTGRACAIAPDAASARSIEAAAAEEGVLMEVEAAGGWASSQADKSFDVAVVDGNLIEDSPSDGQACLREVFRVLRDGARLVMILRGGRGAGALVGVERTSAGAAIPSLMRALGETGFRPVRLLGEREGLSFVEGFRPAGE
jgi:hypothetical protein